MSIHDKNVLVILSSPSGVGKTTLTKKIQQKYQSFKISVSHTTRTPRSNEIDGVDYHFVSKERFQELIKQNKFYEYAKIFENFYGTLKKNVDEAILKNDIRFYAAEDSAGNKLSYNINGSGNSRGTAMVDTRLNGSGNYQTLLAGLDDYRSQEFPNGSPATINTYKLFINKT